MKVQDTLSNDHVAVNLSTTNGPDDHNDIDVDVLPPILGDNSVELSRGNPTEKDTSIEASLTLTRQILITITVTFTTILTSSNSQILNIALPTIQDELKISEENLQWIISSYNLSSGCLLLLSGRIADIYGRKIILLIGTVIFTIFTLAGGFMQNGKGLIVSRALAGCGVAMSTSSTTGIIADIFAGKARSRVFTCFSAGFALGGILGLIIGGIFVSYVKHTWRSALFFVTGIGILSIVSIIIVIPSDGSHTNEKNVDWPGAAIITIGLVLFLFAISDAQSASNGWATSYIIALLIVGILFIATFFFWEYYVTTKTNHLPLMRLGLWTRAKGKLAALYFTTFIASMGFIVTLYNATLFFQEIQNVGSVGTMLRFLPIEISGIIASILITLLIHRIPSHLLLIFALLACGFGNLCFALSKQNTNYWKLPFHGMWLIVFGADFFLPTGLILVSSYSLSDEYSVASGLFSTIQRLGSSIGLSLTFIIFNSQYKKHNKVIDNKEAYLKGLQASF
uniref:Major facilitator superfamily (MFS) profile domain-containing protein n=1 Tax=Kwoniella pini CBS 10737 TaxID=1296096 RepID=A0A1B9I9D3_9TREE|nr:uncharacterized protein I206_01514 [Kwoniella pini CBS 10737]OCF52228.1 hypothetical protein I206_01514 [Kwoniella pini CBS 10737]